MGHDYNSKTNVLKGLRSSNRLASALSRNWSLKKRVLSYLKTTDKIYTNLYDACVSALGKSEVDEIMSESLTTKDCKG